MKLSIKRAPLVSAAFLRFCAVYSFVVLPANATTFSFNTGIVTNSMASASSSGNSGQIRN